MANNEHLEILKKGTKCFNDWRDKNHNVILDLSRAVLKNADLTGANLMHANFASAIIANAKLRSVNLTHANLRGAILTNVNLTRANLTNADLTGVDLTDSNLIGVNFINAKIKSVNFTGANLTGSNLRSADISYAKLTSANLTDVDFTDANLTDVDLFYSNFESTILKNVKFTNARLYSTYFINIDLSTIKDLNSVIIIGPCYIDIATLYKSLNNIPEKFLRKIGIPEDFIKYIPHLMSIKYQHSFISYSHKDEKFAEKLYNSLQIRDILCFKDDKDLKIGDKLQRNIIESIRKADKMILCMSKHSLTSRWVEKEIRIALDREEELSKEKGEDIIILIPLNLDGYLFSKNCANIYKEELKDRLAADFKNWEKDNIIFKREIEKVIKALRGDRDSFDVPPKKKL